MDYEWDPVEEADNRRKHGIGFEAVAEFDWNSAITIPDDRRDYGENRWLAIGLVDDRLYSTAFTLRRGRIRVISLRPASRKERKLFYEPR